MDRIQQIYKDLFGIQPNDNEQIKELKEKEDKIEESKTENDKKD